MSTLTKLKQNQAAVAAQRDADFQKDQDQWRSSLQDEIADGVAKIKADIEAGGTMGAVEASAGYGVHTWGDVLDEWTRNTFPGFHVVAQNNGGRWGWIVVALDGVACT